MRRFLSNYFDLLFVYSVLLWLPNKRFMYVQKLLGYVDTLQANGVADYHKGFEFAFQQFQLVSLIL